MTEEINWDEELVGIVAQQQERIERLEKIVIAMAAGSKSSDPNAGQLHTHWSYPANAAQVLVEEVEDLAAPSPRPPLDEAGGSGNKASKKASESRGVGAQTTEDMDYDAEMALHDGQLCDY